MKPAPFAYHAPDTQAELIELTGRYADEARILAGGQSLMPLMNMRQVRVGHLLDLNGVAGLDHLETDDGTLVVGALVRQNDALHSPVAGAHAPLLVDALRHVASPTVRNRGTVCGSMAFAQPGAEVPAAVLALGGHVVAAGPGGTRHVAVEDFVTAPFVTALQPGEFLKELRLRQWPPTAGHAFLEVSRLGWPVVGVAALVEWDAGAVSRCAVTVTGLTGIPLRLTEVEAALTGTSPDDGGVEEALLAGTAAVEARQSVHGTPTYHRHLARVLVRRALRLATERATGAEA